MRLPQYQERTILLVRQLLNLEATWDEDGELIPTYGVLSATEMQELDNEMVRKTHSQEEVYDAMDKLELHSENAQWFSLFPEYVEAPKRLFLTLQKITKVTHLP